MPTLSEDLWYNCLMKKSCHNTAEEQAALHKVVTEEHILLGDLTAAQKTLFENFTAAQGELHGLYAKHAFLSGVHFAISFLAEALRDR